MLPGVEVFHEACMLFLFGPFQCTCGKSILLKHVHASDWLWMATMCLPHSQQLYASGQFDVAYGTH